MSYNNNRFKMKYINLFDRDFQYYIFNKLLPLYNYKITKEIGIDSKNSNIYICSINDKKFDFCSKKNISIEELIMMLKLSSLVLNNTNPHFLICYKQLYNNNILCELATGDLKSFLKSYISKNVLFNSIIQIIISIYSFHKYTNKTHNDVHHGNFLYHRIDKTDSYFYYKINDIEFYLKNEGYLWIINDFDMSSIDDHKYDDYKYGMEAFKNYNKNKSKSVKQMIDNIIDIIWNNNIDEVLLLELIKEYNLTSYNLIKYNKNPIQL